MPARGRSAWKVLSAAVSTSLASVAVVAGVAIGVAGPSVSPVSTTAVGASTDVPTSAAGQAGDHHGDRAERRGTGRDERAQN